MIFSKYLHAISIVIVIAILCNNSFAQEHKKESPWTGILYNGTKIDVEDLQQIIADHNKWLVTNGEEGKKFDLWRANLQEADLHRANLQMVSLVGVNLQEAHLQEANLQRATLRGVYLQEANLRGANLQKADLESSILQKTDLRGANLRKANLMIANLQKAILTEANLQNANLLEANLQETNLAKAKLEEAILRGANLQKAKLDGAKLQKAILREANLQEASLREANLQETHLQGANLQKANLMGANLQMASLLLGANLQEADLEGANLHRARLEGANLQEANLQRANLWVANLQGANLQRANLRGANLQEADLEGARLRSALFELATDGLPKIPSIAKAYGLPYLRYSELPQSLVELREAFKKAGLRKQEREVTYAIKKSEFLNAKSERNWLSQAEAYLGWLFFDFTCKWGMAPERPIFMLVGLIFLFTLPYAQAISQNINGNQKTDGIWKVWIPGRIREDLGKENPKELLDNINAWGCIKLGFYFSLLSAFNIGWRELNVGNWIARIQPHEYRLQASGWARSVSGIQSIISVYLLALFILTYFGRPFEGY